MGDIRFFRRKPLDFNPETTLEFIPAKAVNVDEFLYGPVLSGLWKQHELWDGTYTLDDLLDINELLQVKKENERRAVEAAERKAGE